MQPKFFNHPVPGTRKSEKQMNSLLRHIVVSNDNSWNNINSRTNIVSLDFPLPLSKYISLGCGTSARLWRGTDITSFGITLQCGLATQTNNLL